MVLLLEKEFGYSFSRSKVFETFVWKGATRHIAIPATHFVYTHLL